jgi:hypothetical protein
VATSLSTIDESGIQETRNDSNQESRKIGKFHLEGRALSRPTGVTNRLNLESRKTGTIQVRKVGNFMICCFSSFETPSLPTLRRCYLAALPSMSLIPFAPFLRS